MIKELNFRGESKRYDEYPEHVWNYSTQVREDGRSKDRPVGSILSITNTDGKLVGIIMASVNLYTYDNGITEISFHITFHPDIENLNFNYELTGHSVHSTKDGAFRYKPTVSYSSVSEDLTKLMYKVQSKLNREERTSETDNYYDARDFVNYTTIEYWVHEVSDDLCDIMKYYQEI